MQRRPSAINVFGILNIAFAVMGFFGQILNAVLLFMQDSLKDNAIFKNNPVLKMMQDNPNYHLIMEISLVVGIPVMILLVVSGIGLLKVKRWGRTLALVYGVLGILMSFVMAFVNYNFLAKPLLQGHPDLGDPQKMGAFAGAMSATFGGCINIIYPALLLYFMTRPHIVAVFRQGPSEQPQPPPMG